MAQGSAKPTYNIILSTQANKVYAGPASGADAAPAMRALVTADMPSTLPAFTTSSITFSPTTGGIVGTTTNDDTAAGKVGEYISSVIVVASAVAMTTATAKTITSISLTAGDWDVWGELWPSGASTTTITRAYGAISLTNNAIPTDPANNTSYAGLVAGSGGVNWTPGGTGVPVISIAPARISISSTTTVYLTGYMDFATSTGKAYGKICARRRR